MKTLPRSLLALAIAVTLMTSVDGAPAQPPRSGKYWVYVGTYTKAGGSAGIYRCELDLQTGGMSNLKLVAELVNPSFLNFSPDGQFLYAVGETGESGEKNNEGTIHAFRVNNQTGDLTPLNSLTSGGAAPCHLMVNRTGKFVIVANYTGGNSSVFSLKEDGSLDRRTDFRQHTGSGKDAPRRTTPHAHCAMFQSEGNVEYAYVVDLGLDKVFSYTLNHATGELAPTEPAFAKLPDGCGPRHIAFNPVTGNAYVCGETDSTIVTLANRKGRGGVLEMFGTSGLAARGDNHISTLPPDTPADIRARNSTAEIAVHPAGGHVLVSNRGHDSLAVFAVTADSTKAAGHVTSQAYSKIRTPRNFNFDPTGKWIVIGSQDGDSVHTAEWSNGAAKLTGNILKVGAPVCLKFLAKP